MADWVLETISTFGYIGLALVLLVENLFPPIPSEIVLPLAGFLVGTGDLNYWGAVFAATFGAVVGAWILYAIGLWGGRPVILRYGKYLWISEEELDRAESWFKRYGDWVVLVARVIPLARSVVSVPAGTMRMPPLRFTVLTTAGTLIWNILLIQAGVILGENWEQVNEFMGTYSNVAYVAIALVVVYLIFKVVTHYRD